MKPSAQYWIVLFTGVSTRGVPDCMYIGGGYVALP